MTKLEYINSLLAYEIELELDDLYFWTKILEYLNFY